MKKRSPYRSATTKKRAVRSTSKNTVPAATKKSLIDRLKLSKFQAALMFFGETKKKPSRLAKLYNNNPKTFRTIEVTLYVSLVVFLLWSNPYYLLALPILGALVFFKPHIKFIIAWLKVYVFKRNFYKQRRELYPNSLHAHLSVKSAKAYHPQGKRIIIWELVPPSSTKNKFKNHDKKFNQHQKNTPSLTSVEIIKNL